MDFKIIMDLLTKANVNQEAIYDLVSEASRIDLTNEENLRMIIRKGAGLANRTLSDDQENKIVTLLKEKGISQDLFKTLKN